MMRSRPCIKSLRCHCDDHDEARRLREDHTHWFLRHVARKDRASLESYARLMAESQEDIETPDGEK